MCRTPSPERVRSEAASAPSLITPLLAQLLDEVATEQANALTTTSPPRRILRRRGPTRFFLADDVPSPRLVGIETNPGPTATSKTDRKKNKPRKSNAARLSGNSRAKPASKLVFSRDVVGVNSAPHYDRGVRINRSGPASLLTAASYLNALKDPFFGPVGKLGFGTFTPTGLHTGWLTITYPLYNNFTLSFTPSAADNAGFMSAPATVNSTLASTFVGAFALANRGLLRSQMQSARVITSGLRAVVNIPATSAPGRMGGVFIPDETLTNLDGTTINTLTNLATYRDFHQSSATTCGGQVAYRPIDMSSYEFVAGPATPTLATDIDRPWQVIIGSGWGTSGNVQVSCFVAFESLGGLDIGGDDDYVPPNISTEDISGMMGKVPNPVTPNLSILDTMDSALSNIRKSSSRSSFRLSGAELKSKIADLTSYLTSRHSNEVDSSGSAASSAPLTTTEEEYGLGDSVYLPSKLLNSMGLKKA